AQRRAAAAGLGAWRGACRLCARHPCRARRAGRRGAAGRARRLCRGRRGGGEAMTDDATTPSPISLPVHVARLPKKGMTVTIDADEAQRAALARLHGLQGVERLVATLDVTAWKRGGVRVIGHVEADIVQQCVVTLEPVPARVDEAVAATFLPAASRLAMPTQSADG